MSRLDCRVGCVQYCIVIACVCCFVPHGAVLALMPVGMWYINMKIFRLGLANSEEASSWINALATLLFLGAACGNP